MATIYVPRVFGGVLIITYTPSTQQPPPINATWVTRDDKATWVTRDDKATWVTRDESATWKARQ